MSELTLDEAIKHCEVVAEQEECFINYPHSDIVLGDLDIESRKHYVAEQKQLAEWLQELRAYRKLRICGNCRHYVSGTTHFGECHVTSDIEPCVVCVNQTACDTFFDYKDLEMESKNNDT